jgi:DNA-binding XRE family transcriptional regulator
VDRLAELRESQALTLRDLAERSGVDANTINQVELGHRKPRPSTLRKLAKALDVDVRELFEEPVPLGEAPPSPDRPFNGGSEERGADATGREGVHLKDYVHTCLDRWERVARGDDPHLAPDYAYSIEISQHVIALTEWFGTLLRTAKAERTPEVAGIEQREIVRLIDRMSAVAAEIRALADAAEGMTAEAVDEEVQAHIDAEVKAVVAEQRPADELAQRRAEGSRESYVALSEAQRSVAEVKKRLAVGE